KHGYSKSFRNCRPKLIITQSGVPTKTDIQGADFSSIRTPRAGCLFTAVSGSFIVSVAIGS
ncbi:MAG: hypothetical protein ACO37W_16165, partial [Prochlorotrichaceae cyanobacterium]